MIAPAPFALHGKRAMVTGGNAGIGEAIALALARAGARVLLVARRADALEAAAQGLRAQGLRAATLAADLAALPALAAVAAQAEAALDGGVDILVNAAGINLRQPFEAVTPEAWQAQLALHLGAPFFLTQALAPGMKQRGWGASSTSPRCRVSAPSPTARPTAPARAASCSSRVPSRRRGHAMASPATPSARASSPPH